MADLTNVQLQALQAQVARDPRLSAILALPHTARGGGMNPSSREAKLYELGQQIGLPKGYYLQSNGTISKEAPWWVPYLGPALAAAGGLALAALPAAGVAGSVAPAASTGGMTAASAAGAPAALSAQILGAGVPTAAAGSIWSRLAPSLIGLGAQGVASYMGSRAAGKAADQQSEAADKALALQREIFERNQANQKPFIEIGTGAASRLNNLMGGSPLSLGQPEPQASGLKPQAAPPQQRAPQMVNMRGPDGSTKAVPFTEVPHWQQLGATRVF